MQAVGINGCYINWNNRSKAVLILEIGNINVILYESNQTIFKAN